MKDLVNSTVLALTVSAGQVFGQLSDGDNFLTVDVHHTVLIKVDDTDKTFSVHRNIPGTELVQILDENDNLIFSDDLNDKKGFAKRFNLNKLESGEYTLSLKNKFQQINYGFVVTNDKIQFDSNLIDVVNSPLIDVNGRYLHVAAVTKNHENATMAITGRNDDFQCSYDIVANNKVVKFDLSQLPKGKYLVSINVANSIFDKII